MGCLVKWFETPFLPKNMYITSAPGFRRLIVSTVFFFLIILIYVYDCIICIILYNFKTLNTSSLLQVFLFSLIDS